MRVTSRVVGRVRDEERGAVLAIVAISLIVLLGMLVLTFDLGRSVAIKRQMVNGADAAALAAAQQCAFGNGTANAQAAASSILNENRSGATMTFFSAPQCDDPTVLGAKTVEVRATVDVNYFFAPVFGLTSGEVGAGAVAIWAPVAQANPIPITVDQAQLTACNIPIQVPAPGSSVPCDIVYPKDTLEEPRWGVLDLAQWNDQDAAPCHVDAATLKDLIDSGGWPTPLPLNGDPPGTVPTYDCLDNGLEFSVWASMEGQVLTFPVIDIPGSTGETKPGGVPCNGDQADCQVDTANVVSFITLLVTSVVNSASTVEVHAEWLGPDTSSGGTIGGGVDFGIRTIRLVK